MFRPAASVLALFVATTCLAGCGREQKETNAVLDKHRLIYGVCEVMAEAKGNEDGKPAWINASVCRAKHRQTVMKDLEGQPKKFDQYFDAWKKEKGPQAVADARGLPPGKPAGNAGGDCPDGAACLNRCRDECEGKHGKMIDAAKMAACAKSGKSDDICVNEGTNQAAKTCFLSCRGM